MIHKPLATVLEATTCLSAIICGTHLTFWAAAALCGLGAPWLGAILGPLFLWLCISLAVHSLHALRTTNRRRLRPWRRHPAVGRIAAARCLVAPASLPLPNDQ